MVVAGNDGGGFYAPGDSEAGFTTDVRGRSVPRSYGAMTYALLKCYLLAGLEKDDPRVRDLAGWISRNFTLEVNPGFETDADGLQGLYYYYHTMAKCLHVLGVDELEDAAGVKHDWRKDITEALAARQRPDGSWINESDHWLEGDPNLVTGYALMTLSYCRPATKPGARATGV